MNDSERKQKELSKTLLVDRVIKLFPSLQKGKYQERMQCENYVLLSKIIVQDGGAIDVGREGDNKSHRCHDSQSERNRFGITRHPDGLRRNRSVANKNHFVSLKTEIVRPELRETTKKEYSRKK